MSKIAMLMGLIIAMGTMVVGNNILKGIESISHINEISAIK